jgi:ParB/RepB/Spo0J family partition protein
MPKPKIDLTNNFATVLPRGELKALLLSQIELDPVTDVRLHSPYTDESEQLENLAKSMFEEGQAQPIIVRPSAVPDKYLLVAGRRRFNAGKLIEKNVAKTSWPIQALIVSDLDDDRARIMAITENVQRQNFSDIEFAKICLDMRQRLGLETAKDWTKTVADKLSVSRATVTQKLLLLDLTPDEQKLLHEHGVSADTATAYLRLTDDTVARKKILADAESIATAESAQKRGKKPTTEKAATTQGKASKNAASDAPSPATGKPEKVKILKKHIVAAARKNEAVDVDKPRTRGEIMEYFLELTGPAFPAPMVLFAQTFIERWATGQLRKNTVLTNQWHAIAALVEAGSRKAAKAAVKEPAVTSKKTVRRAA